MLWCRKKVHAINAVKCRGGVATIVGKCMSVAKMLWVDLTPIKFPFFVASAMCKTFGMNVEPTCLCLFSAVAWHLNLWTPLNWGSYEKRVAIAELFVMASAVTTRCGLVEPLGRRRS